MTGPARRPLVVVEGGAAPDAVVRAWALDLAAAGWAVREGWDRGAHDAVPCEVACEVRTGVVVDADDVRRVVDVALGGAGVVVLASAPRAAIDVLLDDLRRLGRPRHVVDAPAPLGDDTVRLLDLLAAGTSLGEAARRLHLSRRSADRRLAEVRERWGVEGTAAAITARRRRLDELAPDPS